MTGRPGAAARAFYISTTMASPDPPSTPAAARARLLCSQSRELIITARALILDVRALIARVEAKLKT